MIARGIVKSSIDGDLIMFRHVTVPYRNFLAFYDDFHRILVFFPYLFFS